MFDVTRRGAIPGVDDGRPAVLISIYMIYVGQ